MKLFILLILWALSLVSGAAPVALEWEPSPAAERVTGYKVYEVFPGGALKLLAAVKDNSAQPDLPPGIHELVVTAFNGRESLLSDSLTIPEIPSAPKGLKITVKVMVDVSVNGVPVAK